MNHATIMKVKPGNVLIVAQPEENLDILLGILIQAGCKPVIRNRMDGLSRTIRRQLFSFVVIMCDQMVLDPIEPVLIIRDFRVDIPIIVIDSRPDQRVEKVLSGVPRVIYVDFGEKEIIRAISRLVFFPE